MLPIQLPRPAVSRLPTMVVPEIVGGLVFAGRADWTASLGLDVDVPEPSAFLARTCEWMRNPASPSRSVYVLSAALEILWQSETSP